MKHIDKVFRDKLYHQKATVPDGMWEKIAPALEEETGRGIIWFWFAGILALILGGAAYFLLSADDSSTYPLADNSQIEINNTKSSESLTTHLETNVNSNDATESTVGTIAEKKIVETSDFAQETANSNKPNKDLNGKLFNGSKTSTQTVSEKVEKANSINSTSTILKTTEEINPDQSYGKPADLVITKSYVSDNGSFIEQSNLSDAKKTQPTYNVFINSEGLNAGALMRIVEPLENIPLPAFSKKVKKKITI